LKCAIVVLGPDRLVGLDENLRSAWVQLALDAFDDPIRRSRRHGALERDDLDAVVGEEHLPALVGGGDRRRDGGPILLGGSDHALRRPRLDLDRLLAEAHLTPLLVRDRPTCGQNWLCWHPTCRGSWRDT